MREEAKVNSSTVYPSALTINTTCTYKNRSKFKSAVVDYKPKCAYKVGALYQILWLVSKLSHSGLLKTTSFNITYT